MPRRPAPPGSYRQIRSRPAPGNPAVQCRRPGSRFIAAALRKQLAKIETAQNGIVAQIERLGDNTSHAAQAMRDRLFTQYTQRHDQHAALTAELEALTTPATDDDAGDPSLLEELPYAPGLLNQAPAAIRQAIYAAFDIHCLYRHDQGQVTIWATITNTTPGIIQALINDPHTGTSTAATPPRPTCLQT